MAAPAARAYQISAMLHHLTAIKCGDQRLLQPAARRLYLIVQQVHQRRVVPGLSSTTVMRRLVIASAPFERDTELLKRPFQCHHFISSPARGEVLRDHAGPGKR
jgi:hypothetical protein